MICGSMLRVNPALRAVAGWKHGYYSAEAKDPHLAGIRACAHMRQSEVLPTAEIEVQKWVAQGEQPQPMAADVIVEHRAGRSLNGSCCQLARHGVLRVLALLA